MGFEVWGLGIGDWRLGVGDWGLWLGFGVWGLWLSIWDLGFGVCGLGFGELGLGFGVWRWGFGQGSQIFVSLNSSLESNSDEDGLRRTGRATSVRPMTVTKYLFRYCRTTCTPTHVHHSSAPRGARSGDIHHEKPHPLH